jgi:outer membrane receptor protein involved in Fe transport
MIRLRNFVIVGLVSALLSTPVLAVGQVAAQPAATTRGTVTDISGGVIADAQVVVRTRDGRSITVRTDGGGQFDAGTLASQVTVTSEGFEAADLAVTGDGSITVVLRPLNFADSVVVTATRGAERLPSAASATVITAAELNNLAAGALDDALRSTPGFTLFRRNSSRVANPTTQGVTLRGVSGSGSSRTLVLADGVALNDPFGSWVYWNRVPQAAVDRVEVVRGATGDLYGAGALGGVIQVLTVQPTRSRARMTMDGGSHDTFRGSLFGAAERKGWSATGAYEGVRTDGAYIVAPESRGPVDTKADSDYQTGFGSAGWRGANWHATFRGAAYKEERGNGTPVQVNSTDWQQYAVEGGGLIGGGVLQAQTAASNQDYYQTFSFVAASRATERLTFEQFIDTTHNMVNGQWTRPLGRVTMIVGADYRRTEAKQDEFRYVLVTGINTPSGPFVSGGTETVGAVYARANITAGDALTFELGARGDFWNSTPLNPADPTKDVSFLSPRGAVAWRTGRYQVQASVYHANRTPTLNELHRRFAAGTAITNANPLLDPETLTGVEGGVLTQFERTSIRATAFFNDLDGAIANVTLTQTPSATVRQRQNSDSIRAKGLEVEVDTRLSSTVSLNGQMVFTSSHFRGSVATPALEGNYVPQVPVVQGGVGVTWASPRWLTAATQIRFSGEAYDDDLNTESFKLHAYGVWDASFSRGVARGLNAFFAVENILDTEFDVARTPLRQIGWPRTLRVGARVSWQ